MEVNVVNVICLFYKLNFIFGRVGHPTINNQWLQVSINFYLTEPRKCTFPTVKLPLMQGFIISNDTNLSSASIKVYLYLSLFFEGFGYHVHKTGSNVLILNAKLLLKNKN